MPATLGRELLPAVVQRSVVVAAQQPRAPYVDRRGRGLYTPREQSGLIESGAEPRAGDENRTRITSLEGIRAPTRADSLAPSRLTYMHREAPSLALSWGREGPGVMPLFDLFSRQGDLLVRAGSALS